jgi:hypothetical protein
MTDTFGETFVADPRLAAKRIRDCLTAADNDNYPRQALVHVSRWDVEAILRDRDQLLAIIWGLDDD